ncbi:MAG: flagellin [Myxococcota bacterium]|nr:flagellin [Myxococcota bacterium]
MGVRITTNMGALIASRQFNASASRLVKNFNRLATGSRITSARDDVAGLLTSTRMKRDLREYSQVLRNVNDGISLTQVASSTLTDSIQLLQNIRERAVQSATVSIGDDDRLALQVEIEGYLDQLDLLSKTTKYGGISLLDGQHSQLNVKTGSNQKDLISIDLMSIDSFELGHQVREESFTVDGTLPIDPDSVLINEVTIRPTVFADDVLSTAHPDGSVIAKAAAINDAARFTGVFAEARETFVIGDSPSGGTLDATDYIEINSVVFNGLDVKRNDATRTLTNAINAEFDATGVKAEIDDALNLILRAADGRNIEVTTSTVSAAQITGLNFGGPGTEVYAGHLTLKSERQVTLDLQGIDMDLALGFGTGIGTSIFTPGYEHALGSVDITTADEAVRTLEIVDTAIKQLSGLRGKFGRVSNHLESTVNSIESHQVHIELARSRIADVDLAVEAADLGRNQILQKASSSILAQANLGSSVAMTLLEAGRVPLMNDDMFGTVPFRPGSMPSYVKGTGYSTE